MVAVKIKPWSELIKMGTVCEGVIDHEDSNLLFTQQMEDLLPENRLIEVRGGYRWTPHGKYSGIHYIIQDWMIDKEVKP